jgi:hypothetical protein
MHESSFLAEEMGLNHMLKLCWFTLFEMASSIDESNSACIVGASEGGAPAEPKTRNHAKKEAKSNPTQPENTSSWRDKDKQRSIVAATAPLIELIRRLKDPD